MKNLITVFAVSVAMFLLASCGGSGSSVEVQPEMQAFMQMFDGTYQKVEAALNEYAVDELKKHDISMYDMSEPKVTAKEDNCYTMEAKAGMTVRVYKICWTDAKISGIEFIEMK